MFSLDIKKQTEIFSYFYFSSISTLEQFHSAIKHSNYIPFLFISIKNLWWLFSMSIIFHWALELIDSVDFFFLFYLTCAVHHIPPRSDENKKFNKRKKWISQMFICSTSLLNIHILFLVSILKIECDFFQCCVYDNNGMALRWKHIISVTAFVSI